MRHVFESEQFVPFSREVVFAFFANPRNLPPLMPSWQQARIDSVQYCPPPDRPGGTRVLPGVAAGNGTRLIITVRALPSVPLRGAWHALIEDFRWNEGFCDVQQKGPFAYWRHCHTVRDAGGPAGRNGTVIRDHVTYEPPLAPFSELALPVLQGIFHSLFAYRREQTAKLLPAYAEQAEKVSAPS